MLLLIWFLIRVWVWISWSGSSHGYTLTEISEKVWLQTKRNPVMSPHWCECWVLLISLVISVVWPSSVRDLDSLFFVFLLSFLSFFIWLFSSSCSVPWLLLCFCFCSLCLYVLSSPWIFVYTVFEVDLLNRRTFTNLLSPVSFPQHTTHDNIRYGKITTTIFSKTWKN